MPETPIKPSGPELTDGRQALALLAALHAITAALPPGRRRKVARRLRLIGRDWLRLGEALPEARAAAAEVLLPAAAMLERLTPEVMPEPLRRRA